MCSDQRYGRFIETIALTLIVIGCTLASSLFLFVFVISSNLFWGVISLAFEVVGCFALQRALTLMLTLLTRRHLRNTMWCLAFLAQFLAQTTGYITMTRIINGIV